DRQHPAASAEHLLAALGWALLVPASVARVICIRVLSGQVPRVAAVFGLIRAAGASCVLELTRLSVWCREVLVLGVAAPRVLLVGVRIRTVLPLALGDLDVDVGPQGRINVVLGFGH